MLNPHQEELTRYEDALRRLKTQYDLFFAGVRKLPPSEDRKRFDEWTRELSRSSVRDNASRFRLTTLIARYNQFQELWNRQMREREEGPTDFRRRQAALNRAPREAAPAPPRETSPPPDSYVTVTKESEESSIQALYERIAEANRQLGKGSPTAAQVAALVQKQSEDLRVKYGVQSVAFRIEVSDGKVKLKARPVTGQNS